jgi:hypothetical protein
VRETFFGDGGHATPTRALATVEAVKAYLLLPAFVEIMRLPVVGTGA